MVNLSATAGAFFSVMKDAETAMLGMANSGKVTEAAMNRLGTALSVGTVAAVGAFAGESIKMATDFQTAMTHLVTAADLPKSAVQALGDQFMTLSSQVGTSATDLANASYYVLSEGYTWKDTSNIMHTAAQLSIEDQADLTTTTRALVTTMHDYGASSSQATNYGNAFREMLALSGTNMQSLADNMGRVDQVSHALGLDFSQSAGALATLTKEGMDGAQAETLLSTAMGHLAGDTPKMTKELQGLGINVQQFQQELASPQGLVGGIQMVTDAIRNHLGNDGLVYLQQALTKSKGNLDAFTQAMGTAPADVQSYVAALGDAMGGTRNLGVILGLTGPNFDTFKSNVDSVSQALKTGGTNVTNWSDVTQTMSFKSKQLNTDLQDLAIKLGTMLLPAVTSIVGGLDKFIGYLDRNKVAADAFGLAIGLLAAGALTNLIIKLGSVAGAFTGLFITTSAEGGLMAGPLVAGIGTLIGWLGAATAAVGRFAFAWGVIGWEAIASGLSRLGTVLTGTVVPALVSASTAAWEFAASLLANPITWFVIVFVAGLAYCIFWIWAFANNWHGVTSTVAGYMADILIWAVNTWTSIITFLGKAGSDILITVTGAWQALLGYLSGAGSEIYQTCIEPFAKVISYLYGLLTKWEDIGRELVQGMVRGIEEAGAAVISAVEKIVSDAANAAKAIAHIFSPSRLFADEVGKYISLGIAAGITEHGPAVNSSVQGVITGAAGQGSFSAVGTGMGRLGVGGGQMNITYRLEVNAPIIGQNLESAAEDLWQQFLRMQARGTLGFSGSVSLGF